ncbi:MAG: FeoB small GTPase domain-containing protein [Eubacteriales bacterium]
MVFALAGNQNSGKTTLFNALTGSNQHVGNFPGVTVEQNTEIRGVKNAQSSTFRASVHPPVFAEEIVSRDFIIDGKPDGIINIVDATNIERNLYLTLQLLELRIPMVVALNMMDEVRANGRFCRRAHDEPTARRARHTISASKNEGVSELVSQAVNAVKLRITPRRAGFLPGRRGTPLHPLRRACHEDHADWIGVSPFCATKLIEGDPLFADRLELDQNERELI